MDDDAGPGMTIIMHRTLDGLAPDNDLAILTLSRLKLGQPVEVDVKNRRSIPWLRRYWALMSEIAQNSPLVGIVPEDKRRYTPDDVHDILKLTCGCSKPLIKPNGEVYFVPDSIAFDKMSQDAWVDYWRRVVVFTETELLPGVPAQALMKRIADLIGQPT